MNAQSKTTQLLGALAAIIAVVGYVFFGWRFGGNSNPVALGLALVGVALAVFFTLRSK